MLLLCLVVHSPSDNPFPPSSTHAPPPPPRGQMRFDIHLMPVQAALTKRITNRASLEEVARRCIANSTDKLFEVGLNEQKVRFCSLSWVI